MPTILKSPDIRELRRTDRSAIVIGAGPSLKEYNHLKILAESDYNGVIITTDRILVECIKNGVIPDFVCSVDADPTIPTFYHHELVNKRKKKISAILSTVVDPLLLKVFKGKKYFFHPTFDDMKNLTSLTRAVHYMTRNIIIPSIGDVGSNCWYLAKFMECDPICLIGMDHSELNIEDLGDYQQMKENLKKLPKKQFEIIKKNSFKKGYNRYFKNWFWTGPIWRSCTELFLYHIKNFSKKTNKKTINCTGRGAIQADFIDSMKFEEFLEKYKR